MTLAIRACRPFVAVSEVIIDCLKFSSCSPGRLRVYENDAQRMNKKKARSDEGPPGVASGKRFHGSFTGGFSAGYFNTVGSREGFTPAQFVSSRGNRARVKQQSKFDFMDSEDGLLGQQLTMKDTFDTFDSSAASFIERSSREIAASSSIPGPLPGELLIASINPIGKKLLKKLGWKEGQGVGSRVRQKVVSGVSTDNLSSSVLVDGDVTFAPANVPHAVMPPPEKIDTRGIGFLGRDAIVQREAPKRNRTMDSIGAFSYDSDGEYDVYEKEESMRRMPGQIEESTTPSLDSKRAQLSNELDRWLNDSVAIEKSTQSNRKCLSGFVLGEENSEYQAPHYPPEEPVKGFSCIHIFIEDMSIQGGNNVGKDTSSRNSFQKLSGAARRAVLSEREPVVSGSLSGSVDVEERPMLTSARLLQTTFANLSKTFQNRFTPASSTDEEVQKALKDQGPHSPSESARGESKHPSTGASQAKFQRVTSPWVPHPLLSKRMNIPAFKEEHREALAAEAQRKLSASQPLGLLNLPQGPEFKNDGSRETPHPQDVVFEPILEPIDEFKTSRPAKEIFKSIFGSDDEDEET